MGDLFHISDRIRVVEDEDIAGEEGTIADVLQDRFGTLYKFGPTGDWFSEKEITAA